MENNAIKNLARLLAASLLLVVSSTAWSAANEPLDPGYYANAPFYPRIDMTNISLNYNGNWDLFTGYSKASSTFTLYKPDTTSTSFKGIFGVAANVNDKGNLQGSHNGFTFLSNDSMFGFGKDSQGNNKWGNVFSGKLTDLGWSATGDRVEFNTAHFSGWACDQGWCTQAERLWFDGVNGLPNSKTPWKNSWSDTSTYGTAVIPVPAAVWLLGSGLIGLLAAGKRKKNSQASVLPA